MNVHNLKTSVKDFDQINDGYKKFYIAKSDRDYAINDILKLRKYEGGTYLVDVQATGDPNIPVSKENSDMIEVVVTGVWSMDNMFTSEGYVDEIETAIDLDSFESELHEKFNTDVLPLKYVVMSISPRPRDWKI